LSPQARAPVVEALQARDMPLASPSADGVHRGAGSAASPFRRHALTPGEAATSLAAMARPAPSERDEETIAVPRAVRFPVELTPPDGFDPARLETWPRVEGRLEWVGGRLLYMPPCGVLQAQAVADLVFTLVSWVRQYPDFVVGTNEPGIRLGDATRAADAAVWRRTALGRPEPVFAHVPPLLAAEVAGRDEGEPALIDKARWYLGVGVEVVWVLLPEQREVIAITAAGARRYGTGEQLAADARLPGLTPAVDELFRQVAAGRA
jgi:Uma2 family endonuclease